MRCHTSVLQQGLGGVGSINNLNQLVQNHSDVGLHLHSWQRSILKWDSNTNTHTHTHTHTHSRLDKSDYFYHTPRYTVGRSDWMENPTINLTEVLGHLSPNTQLQATAKPVITHTHRHTRTHTHVCEIECTYSHRQRHVLSILVLSYCPPAAGINTLNYLQ